MWNLGEYRKHPQRLADHLPWATLIAPGVILNKDGSLQKTVAFRGPDLDSSTPYELVAARARMNNVLRRLGSSSRLTECGIGRTRKPSCGSGKSSDDCGPCGPEPTLRVTD